MTCFALDSSVIVAALLTWHEQHNPAHSWLETALDSNARLVLPLPVLIEAYAVMTRLPAPHRVSPNDAVALLSGTFGRAIPVVAPSTERVWEWLGELAGAGVAGGRTYDALIVQCASQAGATHLVTLNPRHQEGILKDIEIVLP